MNSITNIWNILMRIVATFAANALAVIGAGAVAGVPVAKAMTVAGLSAVAVVVEKLSRAFMDDGKLTRDEINAAFSTTDKNAVTVQDQAVERRRAKSKIA
jgi:GTP cyclohydrolase I